MVIEEVLCPQVYYKAKSVAMENAEEVREKIGPFYLAAILKRKRKIIKIGANLTKTHPRFSRVYTSGKKGHFLHAEMNVLRFSKPGDEITVLRFNADGDLRMAKPCEHCQRFMKEFGIKKVTYSDWDGQMQELEF
jgi:cytidine deaminase